MTTRAIIFDFGGVLDTVDDPAPWLAKRDRLAARFGMTGQDLWNRIYYTEPWQRTKRGQLSVPEFWDAILGPLGVTNAAAQAEFVTELMAGHDQVHPDMAALLRELKPHYKLGMLSNTQEIEMDRWIGEVHGLVDIFDVVVASAAVGMAKPESGIYTLAIERMGVKPDEALFIDDLLRNTSVAESLGIPSIIFESPAQLRRELQARGILPVDRAA